RDAKAQRVERGIELDLLPLQPKRAGVGRVDAGDDLHQGRLAGAVLAHQGMDMAALQAERDVVERQYARESLAHAFDFEQVFSAWDGAAVPDDLCGRWTDRRHGAPSLLRSTQPCFRALTPSYHHSPDKGPETRREEARLRGPSRPPANRRRGRSVLLHVL